MKLPTAPINRDLRQAVGYQAELRHSQPAFALTSFGAVHLAIHPCGKPQGILVTANKMRAIDDLKVNGRFNAAFMAIEEFIKVKNVPQNILQS